LELLFYPESAMPFNPRIWSVIITLLMLALACGGGGSAPPPDEIPPVTFVPVEPTATRPPTPTGTATVRVTKVIDGDTVELSDGRRVRYIGINTPEHDQPFYAEATQVNQQLVLGKAVQLELDVETFDQYGRTLAYVWVDGVMANLEIVKQGYANTFTVPPNVRYERQFREAEREARQAERGLWAGSPVTLKIIHLEANAPGDDRENPNGEWIEIANQGSTAVDMQGYTLKDAANNIYTFGIFTVRPGRTFRLHSGQGEDSGLALYWGLVGTSVWNNDTDAAFLRDRNGALVDSFAY
jgi:micrococcal nuclease